MTWRCWPKAGLASSTEVNTRTGELLLTRSSRLASSDLSHGWCITSGSSKLQPDPRWAFFQFSLFVQCNQCNSSAPSSHCSRICILRFSKFKKMCFYVFLKRHVKKHRKHYQSFRMITLLTFQLAYTMRCEIIVCQFEVH